MTKSDLVLFLDSVGRTVLGELKSENKTTLSVKNPSVLHVQPNQENGQIQVQLIPVFFKEFANSTSEATWQYQKSSVTRADGIELDDRLVTQYNNMYSVIQAPVPGDVAGSENAPVVKLFDD
tara:strand:- start:1647 stop:2012 length:366 start_codon:yes stop_codon:yes gene_type:complete